MSNALNERYRQYLKAEQAILATGQSYRIGNRLLTRADLSAIQAEINRLHLRDIGVPKECFSVISA